IKYADVIPTGAFFGYQSQLNGIYINNDRLVSALQTEIRDQYFTEEFKNAVFTLCAIDHENKTCKEMKLDDKISDYFNDNPDGRFINILVKSPQRVKPTPGES
ncbi:2266_t:CDS:1, partial [Ambispora gerdemannii]